MAGVRYVVHCFLEWNPNCRWLKSVLSCLLMTTLYLRGVENCVNDGGLWWEAPAERLEGPTHTIYKGDMRQALRFLEAKQTSKNAFRGDNWDRLMLEMRDALSKM